jgi:WD40 repeat protein
VINNVYLWNVANGKQVWKTFTNNYSGVSSIAFSVDSSMIVANNGDNSGAVLLNAATGALGKEFVDPNGEIIARVAFSPDNKSIAAVVNEAFLLFDVANGQVLKQFAETSTKAQSLAFSPDGKTIASGDQDFAVRLWSVALGAQVGKLTGNTESVNAVAYSPRANS